VAAPWRSRPRQVGSIAIRLLAIFSTCIRQFSSSWVWDYSWRVSPYGGLRVGSRSWRTKSLHSNGKMAKQSSEPNSSLVMPPAERESRPR